jgi:NitT/TauT family transport system substrate-binding protein
VPASWRLTPAEHRLNIGGPALSGRDLPCIEATPLIQRPGRSVFMNATLRTLTAASCLSLALATAACGSSASGSSSTVTIGMVTRTTMTWAPQLAAEGQGFLTDELGDTKWKVTEFPGGGPMTTALASGDVDFALLPMAAVIALNAQKRDLRCVFTPSTGSAVVIIAASKLEKSHGTDVAKYDGARWGYSSAGSTGRVVLELLAKRAGLDWDKQNGVALGSAAATDSALATGKVDIVSSDPVSAEQAIQKGEAYVVVNTNDPSDPAFPYADAGVCLATSATMIKEHPDLVQAVVTAESKGLHSVQQHSDSADDVIGLFPKDKGAAWSAGEWELVAPSFQNAGKAANAQVYKVAKDLTEQLYGIKLADGVVEASFDNSFVDKVGS